MKHGLTFILTASSKISSGPSKLSSSILTYLSELEYIYLCRAKIRLKTLKPLTLNYYARAKEPTRREESRQNKKSPITQVTKSTKKRRYRHYICNCSNCKVFVLLYKILLLFLTPQSEKA